VISQVQLHTEDLHTELAECNPTRAPQETRSHVYVIKRPKVLNPLLSFTLLLLLRANTNIGRATGAAEKFVTSQSLRQQTDLLFYLHISKVV